MQNSDPVSVQILCSKDFFEKTPYYLSEYLKRKPF